ncbi:MAG: acyl carrier protein [Kutzneria sp.]|nr:acyl carrier protein [Kutzneria sp.]MBV9847495.1 acyl carrier protein [Kutzneria sp.]
MTKSHAELSEQVGATVRAIIREILREPSLVVDSDDDLRDQLGLDSADLAELIVQLENRLGVGLPDDTFELTDDGDPLGTVGSVTRAVAGRILQA